MVVVDLVVLLQGLGTDDVILGFWYKFVMSIMCFNFVIFKLDLISISNI